MNEYKQIIFDDAELYALYLTSNHFKKSIDHLTYDSSKESQMNVIKSLVECITNLGTQLEDIYKNDMRNIIIMAKGDKLPF